MSGDTLALATRLGEALATRGLVAVTAESCTGGRVAGAITDVAGSSAWFARAFDTYSKAATHDLLGGPLALIAEHGAVSEAVARAMAEGALAGSAAHVAVAITGVAGPGGGTARKPVGMVCFGFARRGQAACAVTRRLQGDRAGIRAAAVALALQGLIDLAHEAVSTGR
jgi:nicotinamide-nucleotide amidase